MMIYFRAGTGRGVSVSPFPLPHFQPPATFGMWHGHSVLFSPLPCPLRLYSFSPLSILSLPGHICPHRHSPPYTLPATRRGWVPLLQSSGCLILFARAGATGMAWGGCLVQRTQAVTLQPPELSGQGTHPMSCQVPQSQSLV